MEMKNRNVNIQKAFFGCNTAHGFHTFYNFFTNLDNARIFIVKGGPGTGKSTFIKTISEIMTDRGYDVELQFCSLDPGSLDAVVIPEIKAAVTAATGHHVFDPVNPGIVDEIINLGTFWNEEGIKIHAKEILALNQEANRFFDKAYRYLGAAELIQRNIEDDYLRSLNEGKLNQITETLIQSIFGKTEVADFIGEERHLFVSAITSEGMVSHVNTMANENTKIIGLQGSGLKIFSKVLNHIANEGKRRGTVVHYYHYPLDRHLLEHIMLPEYNVLITSDCESFLRSSNLEVCDLNQCVDSKYQTSSFYTNGEKLKFKQILDNAVQSLSQIKEGHSELEKYYISNMNFKEVDKCRDKVVSKILIHANATQCE